MHDGLKIVNDQQWSIRYLEVMRVTRLDVFLNDADMFISVTAGLLVVASQGVAELMQDYTKLT